MRKGRFARADVLLENGRIAEVREAGDEPGRTAGSGNEVGGEAATGGKPSGCASAPRYGPGGEAAGKVGGAAGKESNCGIGAAERRGAAVVDARGLLLVPGLADAHVHLREPGAPEKETVASGTRAAARAGYTLLCAMPNLNPPPDDAAHLAVELDIIRHTALVNVLPYGTVTRGRRGRGELSDMEALAPSVCGFSDDGCGVQDAALMERAMREAARLDRPLAAHCEDESLSAGGCIHDGEYAQRHGLRGIPAESEWRQAERDIALAAKTGCAYHVCHVSSARTVELVRRAKASGLRVTCETAPHYLLLTEDDLADDGRFKMYPPLRTAADRDALLEGCADGTIDMIATDHAPHTAAEKSRGLAGSLPGIVGLETAFPALYSRLVLGGLLDAARLADMMCCGARRVFARDGLENGVEAGAPADLALLETDADFTLEPSGFLSRGRCTPFAGWRARGRCVLTLCGGRPVWADPHRMPGIWSPV